MRKLVWFSGALGLLVPLAAMAQPLAVDEPTNVNGMNAVCTGIGTDARDDPRWSGFPLRIEVTGIGGQYLGEARFAVKGGAGSVADVECVGPWLLMELRPGSYDVSATLESGQSRAARVNVPAQGQARVVLRFNEGGAISPQHESEGPSG